MRKHAAYSADDFLAELEQYSNELREMIEAECPNFVAGVSAKRARIERAYTDYEFFVKTYFPHYVTADAHGVVHDSAFHRYIYRQFQAVILKKGGSQDAVAAPRGEAKSTLTTQLGSVWVTVRDALAKAHGEKLAIKFVPIIMDTADQAKMMLAAIKAELEFNPRLKNDFPEVCGAGRTWNVTEIITRNRIKFKAYGSGQKVRGHRHGAHRAGLIFLDDIENDENVKSKEQRDDTYKWVTKAVLPMGPPDGSVKVFSVNTLLHYDSVSNRLQNNPAWRAVKFSAIMHWPDRMDLWDEWERLFLSSGEADADAFYHARAALMEAGAQVSWPAMRPLLALMKIRAADRHAFDCEYQNEPSNNNDAPFKDLHYWVQPSRDWVHFGAHDPSLGKHDKGRDPSASLVGAYDRVHGVLDVVEAKIARITPDAQITQIIDLQREYGCMVWGIETVQFQAFFASELIKRSAALGVPIPVRAVQPSTDKGLRIMSLSPHTTNGLIRFHKNQRTLLEQLLHYPEAAHDDGPDALHMLWALAVSNMGQIMQLRVGQMRERDGLRGY